MQWLVSPPMNPPPTGAKEIRRSGDAHSGSDCAAAKHSFADEKLPPPVWTPLIGPMHMPIDSSTQTSGADGGGGGGGDEAVGGGGDGPTTAEEPAQQIGQLAMSDWVCAAVYP